MCFTRRRLLESKLNVQFPLDLLKSAEAYSLPEEGSVRKCKIFILFPGVPFSCFGFRVIFKKISVQRWKPVKMQILQ